MDNGTKRQWLQDYKASKVPTIFSDDVLTPIELPEAIVDNQESFPVLKPSAFHQAAPIIEELPPPPPASSALGRILSSRQPSKPVSALPPPPPAPEEAPEPFTEGTKENIRATQDAVREAQLINMLGKAASTTGAAIAGVKPQGLEAFDKQAAMAGEISSDLYKRIELEKNDPNSPASKNIRKFLKEKLGIEVDPTASAADLEKQSPMISTFVTKQLHDQQMLQMRKEQLANTKFRQEQLDLLKKQGLELREKSLDERAITQLNNRFDRQIKPLEDTFAAADKVEDLLNGIRNKTITPDKVNLQTLSQDIAQLASVGTRSGLSAPERKKYQVDTLASDINAGLRYITGQINTKQKMDPTVLDQFQAKVNTLRQNAADVYKKRYEALKNTSTSSVAKDLLKERVDTRLSQIEAQSFSPDLIETAATFFDGDNLEAKKYADQHFKGDAAKMKAFLEQNRGK